MIEAGWESWKLAHAFRRIGSGTTPTSGNADYYDDETGTPWITTSELRETYIERTSTNVTQAALDDFTTLRTYAPNSVFMAMYGATIGRLGISTIPATCNQACCVFEKSDRFDNRFLFYWLWHRRAELISLSVGGGQPNLSQQDLKSEMALCPPLEIQNRIAALLDEKTAQIEALIARKQALLERLAEKRQAIITKAVTKGLNPAAPLKDSRIDWLGQIPAHWEVKRLNSFCGFQSGKAHEPFIEPNGAYVCVNARFISTDGGSEKRCTENLCPTVPGDILMVMSDLPNGRALARTFLVDGRDAYAVNQRVCRIRLQAGEPRYFSYQLNRHLQLMRYDDGNEQTHLPNVAFKQLLLLRPTIAEQSEIADFVDDQRAKLEAIISKVVLSIAALQEYRSALITSAVTGQILGLQ